jgi:hypothetical protein
MEGDDLMAGVRVDLMMSDWDVLVINDDRVLGQRKKDGGWFYVAIDSAGTKRALERLKAYATCACVLGVTLCAEHGGPDATS